MHPLTKNIYAKPLIHAKFKHILLFISTNILLIFIYFSNHKYLLIDSTSGKI